MIKGRTCELRDIASRHQARLQLEQVITAEAMDARCGCARTLLLLLAWSATTRGLVIPPAYSAGSGNSSATICNGEQSEEPCDISVLGPVRNKPPVNNGVPAEFLRKTHGQLVVGDGKLTPSVPLWRIVCPEPSQEVIVVVMAMATTAEEYLQVKTTKLSGCTGATPWSIRFKKRSILVGFISSGNATCSQFDLRYVCVESGESAASREANKIFVESAQVLRYLKEHDTPTNSTFDGVFRTAFEKAVYFFITHRRLVSFYRDPDITAIIGILSSTSRGPPTSQVPPTSTQAPPTSTQAPPPTPQVPDPTKNTIPESGTSAESNTSASGSDRTDAGNSTN